MFLQLENFINDMNDKPFARLQPKMLSNDKHILLSILSCIRNYAFFKDTNPHVINCQKISCDLFVVNEKLKQQGIKSDLSEM
jgi:hypothetical protein